MMDGLKPIPTVPAWRMVKRLPQLKKNLLHELELLHEEYGDVFAIQADNRKCFIKRPDLIKKVLVEDHASYEKGAGFKLFHPLIGKGLLTSDGEKWTHERKILNAEFSNLSEDRNEALILEELEKISLQWEQLTELNFSKAIHELTIRTICRMLFEYEIPHNIEEVKGWFNDYDAFIGRQQKSLIKTPTWAPFLYILRARHGMKKLRGWAKEVLEARGEGQCPYQMIKRMKEAGFGDENIVDHILTFFIAGHETSANSMIFTLLLLKENPQYLSHFKDQDAEWIERVIKESLRLYPTIPLFPRIAKEDRSLGEYQIHHGDLVALSPWIMHRSAEFWDKPLLFKPERFIGKNFEKDYIYFPFGMGRRKCIGANLSTLQMEVILKFLFTRFEFSIAGPSLEKRVHRVSMGPTGDVILKEFRRRP